MQQTGVEVIPLYIFFFDQFCVHINVRVTMWVRLDKTFSLVEGLINEFMVISKQRQQFGGKVFFGLV